MQDPSDFLSTLKIDLYPEEVYAFTPKGKVIILPRDASPVDFAYAIHSEVGNKCIGAKVNGRIVPLKSRLKNGDIVEIQTRLGILERDWLSFVKTSRARNKIRTTSMSFKENAQSRSERRSWKRKHENSKSI